MRTISLLIVLCALVSHAAVTIRDTSRSFESTGGGAIISTDGSGSWTASADVSWLKITTTSGNAGKGVPYLVEANNSADVRVGHITVAGNVYTVTQSGRAVDLTPATIEVEGENTSGEIALVTGANVSWAVRVTEEWIDVSPVNGTGPATLTYAIQPFSGVGSRSGTITVGSQTIPVTQTGIDVNLRPGSTNVPYTVTMIPVIVEAGADQVWAVKQNDPWLSIVDAGTGRGGSQVMLCAAENPSFEKRTGTVSIGSGKITVIQDGTSDVSFKILPEVATASPLGAFGNVAVYATPDASWTAESLVDWIHISNGESGAGNGNVKFVANANLDLVPRIGQIRFTPPVVVPDVDLYRGLLFWIKDQVNIEGNEARMTSIPLSIVLDGSQAITLSGRALPKNDTSSFACAITLKVGELGCLNRLFELGGATRSFYLDVNNVLHFDHGTCSRTADWTISAADTWYTLVVSQNAGVNVGGELKIYVGETGKELVEVYRGNEEAFLNCTAEVNLGCLLKLGQTTLPSFGYLLNGQFANIRFWARALTDCECTCVDTKQDEIADNEPKGAPADVAYKYFPLQGNMFSTDEARTHKGILRPGVMAEGFRCSSGVDSLSGGSVASEGEGVLQIKDFSNDFAGSCVTNKGFSFYCSSFNGFNGEYYFRQGNYYYPYPIEQNSGMDATYSFWLRMRTFPSVEKDLISRNLATTNKSVSWVRPDTDQNITAAISNNYAFALSLTPAGALKFTEVEGRCNVDQFAQRIKIVQGSRKSQIVLQDFVELDKWVHVVLVGRGGKSISLYVNGEEAGNVKVDVGSFAWIPPLDCRSVDFANRLEYGAVVNMSADMRVGNVDGSIDNLCFFSGALSTRQIVSMYDSQKPDYVYHTVTQGVIQPTLSTYSINMSKGGGNANVSLSLAKGVNWSVTTSDEWLSVAGDTSGSGSAEFTIKVAANPTVVERVGTVTIAGKTVRVTQEGLKCDVVCSTTVFGTAGDMGTIAVNPELGGSWTAKTDDDWIYIVSGESGTGSGDVWFITEGYDDTTGSRTGVITIGGEKVYITQRGFELSINPMVAEIGGNAGAGRIGVSADPNAVWTALAQEDWIEIVAGGEGVSDGTVVYRVTDNTTGQTRTGHINISGQMYTITQTCTLKLTAFVVGNGSVNGAGDYSQGKEVTLRAVPDAGNVFSHWSGDVVGNDEVTTIKMDSVKNVTATFIPEAAAQKLAEQKAAQGGFYTRDQIHALEMGNLVFDVDASGTARVGVQLMETSDLSNPNSWKPATLSANPDVGADGTVGMKVKAEGNAKFFKVVIPEK